MTAGGGAAHVCPTFSETPFFWYVTNGLPETFVGTWGSTGRK